MNVRRMTMVVVLAGLALAPVVAMAQGPGHQMGMRGRMGSDSGSMMQMQGMMQQMGDMMNKMSGMMGGGMVSSGGQAGETMGSDTPQQIQGMMERMTEIHKRMSGMMMAPQAAPQTTPQQEKK